MPNIEVIEAVPPESLLRLARKEVVWVSPLEVAFSQNVIYPRFADGRSVDDTVGQIRVAGARPCRRLEEGVQEERLALEPPFPMMEAVRWCPKLRDGHGKPLADEQGNHRRGPEGLFSVDNRRLYALQRAAVAQYPRQCCVAVAVITERNEVLKHLKKFRTRTNGLSITVSEWNGVGRDNARAFSAMRVWDWRSAVARAAEGGAEASMLAAEAASTGSCGCWEYLDHRDIRRGPFSNWQMRQWWERKMFPPDLRIRPYDAAATVADKEDGEEPGMPFLFVEEVFQDAPSAFAPGFSPRATDGEADWKRCSQCGRRRWEGWSASGEWYCATCWRRWAAKAGVAT
mmetsp:Transcript_129476/g.360670  ORF Transcript_129476/g.360670 Transcript_129476/m.360670 type:complete len:343 (-) Transcript_129476:196-1224(-)